MKTLLEFLVKGNINKPKFNYNDWHFIINTHPDVRKKYGREIYYPNATEDNSSSVGSCRFLRSKFWKLYTMMGYDPHDTSAKGVFNTTSNIITDFLDKLNVEYKIKNNQIHISGKKSNIDIINIEYENFFYNWTGPRSKSIEEYKLGLDYYKEHKNEIQNFLKTIGTEYTYTNADINLNKQ